MKNTIFKRALSLVVAILLVLPMIASSVMALDTENNAIISQPTNDNPTFEVADGDNASYQWYEATSGEITDRNAETFSHVILSGESEYNEEEGWLPVTFILGSGGELYIHYYFVVEINQGEELYIDLLGGNTFDIYLVNPDDSNTVDCNIESTENGYVFSGIQAEKALLCIVSEEADMRVKAEIPSRASLDKALDGETNKSLSHYELGKSYACKATLNDGTEIISDVISFVPGIVKNPSATEPSVKVTLDEYAKYEWYYVNSNVADVTDKNASIIDGNEILEIDSKSSYDENNGWTPITNDEDPELIYHYYFEVELNEGESLTIDSDLATDEIVVVDSKTSTIIMINERGEFVAEKSGKYILFTINGNGKSIKAQVKKDDIGEKIEGQQSSILTSYEPNEKYICKVTWTKNEATVEKYSKVVKMEYAIITEPSSKNPEIKVSFESLVEKYEWFKCVINKNEITDENASAINGASYDSQLGWVGGVDNNDGMGTPYFEIALLKGEEIFLSCDNTSADESDFMLDGNYKTFAEKTPDGLIKFTAPEDEIYRLYSDPSIDVGNIRVYFRSIEIPSEPLANQNTSKLTEYENGDYFAARVTYKDGSVLESEMFLITYEITSQPTSQNPTVETNKNNDVIKYKWYYIEKLGLYDVAFYTVVNDSYILESVYDGQYIDGKWTSESGYVNIGTTMIEGDILKVTVNDGFNGYVGIYGGEKSFEFKDGSYFYYVDGVEFVDIEIEDENDNEVFADVEVIRGERSYKLEQITDFNEKNGTYLSPDVDDGYYKDGKWISEKETSGDDEYYQVDLEFYLENEYTVTVKLSEIFDGYVFIDDIENSHEQEVEIKNGVATFKNDGSIYYFELKIESDKEFSAEIILTYDDKDYTVIEQASYNEETKTYEDVYVNDGIYKDGFWYPVNEYGEVDIEIALEKCSVLVITLPSDFKGEVYIDDVGNEIIYLEGKNGVYTYTATEDVYPDVQIYDSEGDYKAKIQIDRGNMVALEGQSSKTLSIDKVGQYFAELTFKNGLALVSDIFEVNSQVVFDTNGGSALDSISTITLTEIAKTVREGFILDGWYLNEELTEKVELPLDVVGVVTLYAKWSLCNHESSTQKASCTEDANCTVCGSKYKATGHNYNLEYTKTENSHYYECKECGNKKKESQHTFSEWVDTKFAERNTQGEQKQVCTVCSYANTRATEKLGGLSNGATVGIIIASGAALSALAVGIWFILKKKLF